MNQNKNYFLMVVATFFWSGAFIAGKFGISELSPIMLTYLRFFFATIILFPYMISRLKDQWILEKKDYITVLQLAIVGMIGYHLPFFLALKYTTASKAAMINASNPLITAFLAVFFLKDTLTPKRVFYIILALFGVVLTITDWQLNQLFSLGINKGDLIMLSGTFCWSSYSIFVKKATNKITPLKLTSYTFLFCVVLLTPLALKEIVVDHALSVSTSAYGAVIYMAIFPTVIGYTIQQMSIKNIGPAKTSLFINLVPVISTLLAMLILKETVNPNNIVSGLMIIGAVIGNSRLK